MEARRRGEAEFGGLALIAFGIGAVADHERSRRDAGLVPDFRERGEEEVGPLQVAHHADIEEVGRIGLRLHRNEFGIANAVRGDDEGAPRRANLGAEGLGLEGRDEDEGVGEAFQRAFEEEEHFSGSARHVVVKTAAMGTIEAGGRRAC